MLNLLSSIDLQQPSKRPYSKGADIELQGMGVACSMYGRRAYKILVGKSEGKLSLRTHRLSWEDNIIKMGWDGVNWKSSGTA